MGLTINRMQYYTVRLENTLNKFCVIKLVLWFEQHTEHNIHMFIKKIITVLIYKTILSVQIQ